VSGLGLIVFFYSLLILRTRQGFFPTRQCPGTVSQTDGAPMKMTGSGASGGWVPHETSLSDILNDPVIRAVMHADGVNPDELARILHIPVRGRPLDRPDHAIPSGASASEAPQPMSPPAALPEVL
jgi:hypothetical protein